MITKDKTAFPWLCDTPPIMLAPMQGLTNRGLRSIFARWARPDTLFTEFIRVAPGSTNKRIAKSDLEEIGAEEYGIPLVVQLIGHGTTALTEAAETAQKAGAAHINLNLGCPFGRMNRGMTGGGMLQKPELLEELLPALRKSVKVGFSVKIRAGYNDRRQIFSLLPLFESSGVEFIVLHPRTVVQEYSGLADHQITKELVSATSIPVIANGDIRTVSEGLRVLEQTGASGLMIGRGAIADPLLFERLRSGVQSRPSRDERGAMLQRYLLELVESYSSIFCGELQILGKVKTVLSTMDDPDFYRQIKALKKARSLAAFTALAKQLA